MDLKNKKKYTSKNFLEYASYYDILYQDKDYVGESLFISRLIDKVLPNRGRKHVRILDLACGTGRHAMELARLGYQVEGSDLSEEMIKIAKKESKKKNLKLTFYNESFQTAGEIGKKYDIIISMFSAINYLTTYDDFSISLKNIYSLLADDGFFIFDFWSGNAVVKEYSPVRVKRMSRGNMEVLRISNTTIDKISQTASLKFNIMLFKGNRVTKEFKEEHNLRYFFLQEMVDLLRANNFEIVLRCPFMDAQSNIADTDWNVTYVVRPNHGRATR